MDTPETTRLTIALDAVAAVALALAGTIAVTDGFTIDVAGLRLGLHSWPRAALAALVVFGIRTWRERRRHGPLRVSALATAFARVALSATALSSIGYWVAYLTVVCGGSDSYGYVSASRLILAGRLIEPQAIATWLPVSDPLAVATPAAYAPAADGSGIAPVYPLGFPALMALATLAAGSLGPYLVPPICGVVCVVLAWRLGSAWYGPLAGWLAAALVAWEPLVVTYAKQPMSDVPATMWTLLAVWWLREPRGRPFAAGVAAGLSFVTRPGGLGALAVVGAIAIARRDRRWTGLTAFAAGAVPFASLQALLHWRLYGGPFATGFGDVTALYAGASVWANVQIYADAIWRSHTWFWLIGIAAAWWRQDRRPAGLATLMLVTGAGPYLLYWRFDHWETLRFLLPAIVLLTIVCAGGLVDLLVRATRNAGGAAPILAAACALAVAASSERYLRAQGVPGLREAEARYPRVAARLVQSTPESAVVLAMQHSGSIRHYARRQTLRWDVLRSGDLEAAVSALAARGHSVYVVLEGQEQRQFEEKFADPLTRLRRLPAGQVGNVQIWQLEPGAVPPV